MKAQAIDSLVAASQAIGSHIAYAQGGGGNTSIKYNQHNMLIKASGITLASMQRHRGFVNIHTQSLMQQLQNDMDDTTFSHILSRHICPRSPQSKPSIETSLHLLLKRCVIHCHSVYANVLNCSYEGEDIIRRLFPTAVSIPYATVGLPLARILSAYIGDPPAPILFLQNHGLIVHADDMTHALALHHQVQQKIIQYLAIDPHDEYNVDHVNLSQDILFPDQVVYLQTPSTRAYQETYWACNRILQYQHQQRLSTRFLTPAATTILRGLSSETYRQEIAI